MALNQILAYTIDPISPPGPGTATQQAESLLSRGIGVATIAAILYFAIQIILAGFSFLSSEGDEKKAESARKRITDGLVGIIVVIAAVTLVSLLGRILGLGNILNLDQVFTNMGF
jgi:hypothetical protein